MGVCFSNDEQDEYPSSAQPKAGRYMTAKEYEAANRHRKTKNDHSNDYHDQHQYYQQYPPRENQYEDHYNPNNSHGPRQNRTGGGHQNRAHQQFLNNNNNNNSQYSGSTRMDSYANTISQKRRNSKRRSRSRKHSEKFTPRPTPFHRGSVDLSDLYDRSLVLGRGGFGIVVKVYRKIDLEPYACKVLSKKNCDEQDILDLYNERELMDKCQHKHIVQLVESFDDKEKMSIVMELMEGGELFDRLIDVQEFSERDAAKQIKCIFHALAFMHELGIIHRDLKPENLCYADKEYNHLKIIDLGMATYENTVGKSACGTFEFLAPEQMAETGYDSKVDVFALGIIVHVMLLGYSPFEVPEDEMQAWDNLKVWHRKMLTKKITFSDPKHTISKTGQDFILRCLEYNPARRISAKEALLHSWLRGSKDTRSPVIYTDNLRRYQCKRRFKRGVNTILSLNRLVDILRETEGDEDIPFIPPQPTNQIQQKKGSQSQRSGRSKSREHGTTRTAEDEIDQYNSYKYPNSNANDNPKAKSLRDRITHYARKKSTSEQHTNNQTNSSPSHQQNIHNNNYNNNNHNYNYNKNSHKRKSNHNKKNKINNEKQNEMTYDKNLGNIWAPNKHFSHGGIREKHTTPQDDAKYQTIELFE